MASPKNTFNWEDPFLLTQQLSEDERHVQLGRPLSAGNN